MTNDIFQPYLQGASPVDTSRQVVDRRMDLSGLGDIAGALGQIKGLKDKKGGTNLLAEVSEAQAGRTAEALTSLQYGERANELGFLEDSRISDEENARLISELKVSKEQIDASSPAQRAARLQTWRQRVLNDPRYHRSDDATVKAINTLLEIDPFEQAYKNTYGDEIIKQVQAIHGKGFTSTDLFLTLNRNKSIAKMDYDTKVMQHAAAAGKFNTSDFVSASRQYVSGTMAEVLGGVRGTWAKQGFLDDNNLQDYRARLAAIKEDLYTKANDSIQRQTQAGYVVENQQELFNGIDTMLKPYEDVAAQLGSKDVAYNDRIKGLLTAYAQSAAAESGVPLDAMLDIIHRGGWSLPVLEHVASMGGDKAVATLKSMGITTLEGDDGKAALRAMVGVLRGMLRQPPEYQPGYENLQDWLAARIANQPADKSGPPPKEMTAAVIPGLDGVSIDNFPTVFSKNAVAVRNMQLNGQGDAAQQVVRTKTSEFLTRLKEENVILTYDRKADKWYALERPAVTGRAANPLEIKYRGKSYISYEEASSGDFGDTKASGFRGSVQGPAGQDVNLTRTLNAYYQMWKTGGAGLLANGSEEFFVAAQNLGQEVAPVTKKTAPAPAAVQTRKEEGGIPARVERYSQHVDAAVKGTELSPAFIKAVMHNESGGDPEAVSEAGAAGLMQIMPDTATGELGLRVDEAVDERKDPKKSVSAGVRYLNSLFKQFKDRVPPEDREDVTWAAYNHGPGNLKKILDRAEETGRDWMTLLPAETKKGLARITRVRRLYETE